MRVLMIAPEPFLETRGTPISVYQRLRALSSLGHRVDLLTYHVGQDVNIPSTTVHRIPNIPFIKEVKIGPSWPKLILDVLIFFKAITMMATKPYDVIHTHEEAVFFSMVLAAMFHTRHLYDMHSSLPQQLKNFNSWNHWLFIKLFELLERWAIRTCDGVITISSDLREYVKKINPAAKQVMIENLAIQITVNDTNQPSVKMLRERLGLNGELPIVYTGNFECYQGVELLIESAEIVKRQHPKVLFVFVGGKLPQVEYWQNEMRRKNLEDCTLFVGSVPLEEVSTYLEMAEILVSPRLEGTSVPLKLYSYLLSGKPTVATNLLPHTQVLDEEMAMLVAPTKEAFAEGIIRLIRDPDLRRQLGFKAQKFANEKYAPASYLNKLEQIYQMLESSEHLSKQPVSSVGLVKK